MKKLLFLLLATVMVASCGTASKKDDNGLPKVYMTTDISPEGLVKVYDADRKSVV